MVRIHPLHPKYRSAGLEQTRKGLYRNRSLILRFFSISVSIADCHFAETSSTLVRTAKYSSVVQLVERRTVNPDAERNRKFKSCRRSQMPSWRNGLTHHPFTVAFACSNHVLGTNKLSVYKTLTVTRFAWRG